MDSVELMPKLLQKLQRIPLVEREWVLWLWFMVNAHNVKASPVVSHPGPAAATKQV
jgi:hypothetical protein